MFIRFNALIHVDNIERILLQPDGTATIIPRPYGPAIRILLSTDLHVLLFNGITGHQLRELFLLAEITKPLDRNPDSSQQSDSEPSAS